MRLVELARIPCADGGCPAVFATEGDALVIQGYLVDSVAAGVDLPPGELLVEVPRSVLRDGLAKLEL